MMREFYGPFLEALKKAESATTDKVEVKYEVSDVPCEKCGRMMVIKYGRFGKFLACPGFPDCKNAKPIAETVDVPCPVCGGKVQIRKTKAKKNYYICENNTGIGQGCDYISWNPPKEGEKFDASKVTPPAKKVEEADKSKALEKDKTKTATKSTAKKETKVKSSAKTENASKSSVKK
jgi:ssDNA-binding Zn-finger/Zn-ribbon topoisomerase 1